MNIDQNLLEELRWTSIQQGYSYSEKELEELTIFFKQTMEDQMNDLERELLQEHRHELEAVESESYNDGYSAGEDAGYDKGYKKGLKEGESLYETNHKIMSLPLPHDDTGNV